VVRVCRILPVGSVDSALPSWSVMWGRNEKEGIRNWNKGVALGVAPAILHVHCVAFAIPQASATRTPRRQHGLHSRRPSGKGATPTIVGNSGVHINSQTRGGWYEARINMALPDMSIAPCFQKPNRSARWRELFLELAFYI
jgi:hypothetical protein